MRKIMEIDTPVFHVPVLIDEVIEGLDIHRECWYIDATSGGGGHTSAILRSGGNVLACDQDEEAIERLTKRFSQEIKTGRVIVKQGNFRDLKRLVKETNTTLIYGVLFDLGMSTYQIKQSGRGFSFLRDEPLDMRMSKKALLTAAQVVNIYSKEELTEIFRKFGEEIYADRLSQVIVDARRKRPFIKTGELAGIAGTVYRDVHRKEKIHPATRMFQALRIVVNDELTALREGLEQAFAILENEGRLLVISFHSLEDRIVKQYFQKMALSGKAEILTKNPIHPGEEELEINTASRPARLRILIKNNN